MLEQAKGDGAISYAVIHALGQTGAPEAVAPILTVLAAEKTDPNVRLEAVTALGALKSHEALPFIQDLLTDEWPTMRAAAVRASAAIDPEGFVVLLSGMEPDPHWTVSAAIAEVLGAMPAEVAIDRLQPMFDDQDKRVVPPAIEGLAKLNAPGIEAVLLTHLKNPDIGIRTAAARAIGQMKLPSGAAALRDAYRAGQSEGSYDVRDAALTALARYGAAEAMDTEGALATGPGVRLRAASLPAISIRPWNDAGDPPRAERPIAPYDSPG
jgi:HEAT repeat protein